MKKFFTLVLLVFAVLYFSPAVNARTVHVQAKHKHHKHHYSAHKNGHKHWHGKGQV
jgi:hypothetical protein